MQTAVPQTRVFQVADNLKGEVAASVSRRRNFENQMGV